MMVAELITWWYGRGWKRLLHTQQTQLLRTARLFSISVLLRTLFSPWRRIVTYPDAGLHAHVRAGIDNLVSRVVGFSVRTIVLITAGAIELVVGAIAVMQLIAWPLLPIALIACVVKGMLP